MIYDIAAKVVNPAAISLNRLLSCFVAMLALLPLPGRYHKASAEQYCMELA
jgi:hypothetical protein